MCLKDRALSDEEVGGVDYQATLPTHDPQVAQVEHGTHLGRAPIFRRLSLLLVSRPVATSLATGAIDFGSEEHWVVTLSL